MSKQDGEARLPKPFEAMLESWPVAERDDAFWDDGAEKITERLAAARAEASAHGGLLDAPLPPEAGEPGFPSGAKAEEPPPRSLAELARMSLATEAPKSDATDIALASLSLANGARASSPMIAEAAAAARASEPPAAPVAAVAPVHPLPVRPAAQRSAAGPLAMAAIGLIGLAAAAVIVVRAQRQGESSPIAAAPPSAAPPAVAAQATAAPAGEDIVALDDLSPGKAGGAAPSPRASGDKLAAKGGEAKAEEPPKATEAKPGEAPEAVAKAEEKKDDEAAKLMKPAATAGDLPDKPSTGAVQAAIGSVMGSARACVAGHDEASRATITFGSDGRVQSVAVSGKAAGTPAEACIKAALGKARVQAFARPSFSVGAAIRP